MKNRAFTTLLTTMALAATLGLVGCGGSQAPATDAAAPAAEATVTEEKTATTEAAPAESTAETTKTEATTTESSAPAPAQNNYIGDEAAKSAALAHAGFAATDVTELESELDLDDAIVHYDVDFKSGGMEYDYDIDAVTGEVLTFSSEVDD
ncbi:MAG: PepSY domain-containing protein [Atopobiaceae bacterium]|nr:PepSY domain-containing protein [Atopobiaceae bacterium]